MKNAKKKKSKPREKSNTTNPSGCSIKDEIFKIYVKEMEEETERFKLNTSLNTKFYLFQNEDKTNIINNIFNLCYFYDKNFTGNKDFMHVPNINQITYNVTKFPIMMATKKNEYGLSEILGATTIKFDEAYSNLSNPYYPCCDEPVLSITGMLTNQNILDDNGNKIKGIGRELYKSAIKGAYNLNKEEKIKLICEIDCRNVNSMKSISKAVIELQNEGMDLQLCIAGYYEIYDDMKNIIEAPTFILEIDLNNSIKTDNKNIKFSYLNCNLDNLNEDLVTVIKSNTQEKKRYLNIVNNNIVIYHEVKPINALNIDLEIGKTAEGNDRVPVTTPLQIEYIAENIKYNFVEKRELV